MKKVMLFCLSVLAFTVVNASNQPGPASRSGSLSDHQKKRHQSFIQLVRSFPVAPSASQKVRFCIAPHEYQIINQAYYAPSNLISPPPVIGSPFKVSYNKLPEGKTICTQYCTKHSNSYTQGVLTNMNFDVSIVMQNEAGDYIYVDRICISNTFAPHAIECLCS